MIKAGVDLVRLNFSHGSAEIHMQRAQTVRDMAKSTGRTVGILADLQGPKIRVGKFEHGKVFLKKGEFFILDATLECLGNSERVGIDYKQLPQNVQVGSILLLDDGMIELEVVAIKNQEIHCVVNRAGVLTDNKGINQRGGGITASALTEKDYRDIKVAALIKADYLAVSFVSSAADIELARRLIEAEGGKAMLLAKIERSEAILALEEIIEASDAIMVARGDLAIEVGDASVPGLQKKMIAMARTKNKLIITATQMMESMITKPIPTRAEVSDVANAVLDGTDAVMLAAETAIGNYPVETVETMSRICIQAECEAEYRALDTRTLFPKFKRIDQTIAMSALFAAAHFTVKAIAALTQSGATALWMSRANTNVPIFALTPVEETLTRVTLFSGVHPIAFHFSGKEQKQQLYEAEQILLKQGLVKEGDILAITVGEAVEESGHTNTLKIIRVGDRR